MAVNSGGYVGQAFQVYYDRIQRKTRRAWCKKIKESNDFIFEFIDIISVILYGVVFDESSLQLKYPAGI
jgi:hypothetical protein